MRRSKIVFGFGATLARLLIFVPDPNVAARLRRDSSTIGSGIRIDERDHDLVEWLSRREWAEVEVIDPGTLTPADPGFEVGMDRHRLDVALSAGRHAAERARLAGCLHLRCMGLDPDEYGTDQGCRDPLRRDRRGAECLVERLPRTRIDRSASRVQSDRGRAYQALGRLGAFDIAALVGAAVASAQMGMGVSLHGARGRIAGRIATGLHPRVADWIRASGSPRRHVRSVDQTLAQSLMTEARAGVSE